MVQTSQGPTVNAAATDSATKARHCLRSTHSRANAAIRVTEAERVSAAPTAEAADPKRKRVLTTGRSASQRASAVSAMHRGSLRRPPAIVRSIGLTAQTPSAMSAIFGSRRRATEKNRASAVNGEQDVRDEKEAQPLAEDAPQQCQESGIDRRVLRMGGEADVKQIYIVPAPERSSQEEINRVIVAGGDPGDPNAPGQEPVKGKQGRGDPAGASR